VPDPVDGAGLLGALGRARISSVVCGHRRRRSPHAPQPREAGMTRRGSAAIDIDGRRGPVAHG